MTYRVFLAEYDGLVDCEPVGDSVSVSTENNLGVCDEIINNFFTEPTAV